MAMEHHPYFSRRLHDGGLVVKDLPKFDLESYISIYDGPLRSLRLAHIARSSPVLAIEALHMVLPELKTSKDVSTYIALSNLLHELDPRDPLAVPDSDWVERKNKENSRETERLEQELRGYKNNLIKESIRMGQEDLASHHLATLDFDNATKSFQRMREFCTTPKHVAEMTLKLIYTSVLSSNWIMVQNGCIKERVLTIKAEDKAKFDPAVHAASGLAFLGVGEFSNAARSFIRVHPSYLAADPLGSIVFQRQVLTGNDIATYGGLTALASMDREQLRSQVLDNADFRTFLELEPHIRHAISAFCDGKFSACLRTLESYRTDHLLDFFLAPQVTEMYARIRSKSIVQYFVPFSHVRIPDLAKAFPRPESASAATAALAMEEELADMIHSGLLDARIDTVSQLLLAPPRDSRAESQQGVLDAASEIEHALRLRLHKLSMAQAGLELSNPKAGKGLKLSGGGGGGGISAGGYGGSSGPWDVPELGTPMSNA